MKKNIILAFLLSLFAMAVFPQTYDVRWFDRIGPNNVTIVADFSGFGSAVHRRVMKNAGPYYAPNWQFVREDDLVGQGVDTIVLSTGGTFLIKILDSNYQQILSTIVPNGNIQNSVSVLQPPVVIVDDQIYGTAPHIGFKATVDSHYGLSRDYSDYRTILYCDLYRTYPANDPYGVTIEFLMPPGGWESMPQAWFDLPPQWFGDYCMEWRMTDEDISLDSHFGLIEVWSSGCYSFSYGSTGLTSSHMKAQFRASPNPFVDMVNVESSYVTTYNLISLTGQVVRQGNLMFGENQIDFGGLTPGAYILQTEFGITKLIKQ